jgi:hypothetical protein
MCFNSWVLLVHPQSLEPSHPDDSLILAQNKQSPFFLNFKFQLHWHRTFTSNPLFTTFYFFFKHSEVKLIVKLDIQNTWQPTPPPLCFLQSPLIFVDVNEHRYLVAAWGGKVCSVQHCHLHNFTVASGRKVCYILVTHSGMREEGLLCSSLSLCPESLASWFAWLKLSSLIRGQC